MDHPDFDQLARTMSTGASRRSLLRRMAASALASPMGFLGIASAQADGKDNKGKRKTTTEAKTRVTITTVSASMLRAGSPRVPHNRIRPS